MRASVKRTVKKWSSNQHPSKRFQYDPSSYALNFDDGRISAAAAGGGGGLKIGINVEEGKKNSVIWVYVFWV
ncbi:hypothetical protein LINGRAHAP2_LOCUS5443 [Linum grandiflorum]